MPRPLNILAAIALALSAAAPSAAPADDAVPFVAVTAIARDAAIDAIVNGMSDALRAAGYRDGETLRLSFEAADADTARAAALVDSFIEDDATIIVAITEPSARIAAARKVRVPLVVAGIGVEAANELRRERNTRLLTGITDGERFDTQLALIRDMAPGAVSVAVIVDADTDAGTPADRNALRLMTAFARGLGLAIEELPVSLENSAIAAKIEGYAPADTVLLLDRRIFPAAPVARIIAAAEAAGLMLFASDEDTVVRGALAAVVPDAYGTGRQVGRLVAQILDKPAAARTPLKRAEPSYVVVNAEAAARVDLDIPEAVRARRGRIFDSAHNDGPRPRGKPLVAPPPAPEASDGTPAEGAPAEGPPLEDADDAAAETRAP